MAEQKRNQPGSRNRNQHSPQQGSQRPDDGDTQQTQGNQDESFSDDEAVDIPSSDRNRSNREPASIADDRSIGKDRQRRNVGGDPDLDELDSDIDTDTDSDAEDFDDDDIGGGGRSNR